MRIVIAPDSFKECASAADVAAAIARGIHRAFPDWETVEVPMADGGEGTVDALVAATGGRYIDAVATGPLGEKVSARYGLTGDDTTAVIEMAAASGLALVPQDRRDPRITTTRGTGDLIRHALDLGVRRIIIGIGGSATNDGGAGMAQALGYSLLDANGDELAPGGTALAKLARIASDNVHPRLAACEILVACDVTNPLLGPSGSSHVYGPQKGAAPEAVRELESALDHFADVLFDEFGADVRTVPGGGAAGGLGAGLIAFAKARLAPGARLVAEAAGLERCLRGADLVITGEGRLDNQTAFGKTPAAVAQIAQKAGVPVVAVAGSLGEDYETVYQHGIDAAFSIVSGPMPLVAAIEQSLRLLENAGESVARLWAAARGGSSG